MAYTYTVQRTIHADYSIPGSTRNGGTVEPGNSTFNINIQSQFDACGHHSDAVITGITIFASWSGSPPASSFGTPHVCWQAFRQFGASYSRYSYGDINSSGGSVAIPVISPNPIVVATLVMGYTTAPTWSVTMSIRFTYTSNVAPTSTFTCGNATLGSSHTVTISAASSSLSHRVTWSCGSYSHSANAPAGTTSVSYTIPASWGSAFPTANSATLTVKLETLQGSTVTGTSTQNKTVSAPSYVPAAGSLSLTRLDNGISALSSWGVYVQNKSGVTVSLSGYSTSYGATISTITFSGGASQSGSGSSVTKNPLTTFGTVTFKAKVTDSRGKSSGEVSASITVYAYGVPVVSTSTAVRSDSAGTVTPTGESIKVTPKCSFSSCNGNNSVNIYAKWGNQAKTSWSSEQTVVNNTAVVMAQNQASQYNSYYIRIRAVDALGSTSGEWDILVSSIELPIHIRSNNKGLAVGMVCEQNGFSVNPNWAVNVYGMTLKQYIQAVINGTV